MKGAIDQIFERKFDYENGSLDFSCSKLEMSVHVGETREDSFLIFTQGNVSLKGYITTSDVRVECLTPVLEGTDMTVKLLIHGEQLEEGEVVKGYVNVISTHGEYSLPFVISVEYRILNSSIGPIKNLFHFANLAKSNWQEALALFYSKEFERVFMGSDANMFPVYKGLSTNLLNEQNMEEFLIHINKKTKVEYMISEKEIVLDFPSTSSEIPPTELLLEITKNGWGYTALNVECDGNFVYTEKSLITDDDFLGNICRLRVFADPSACRNGKNFGRVVLFNSYDYMIVEITCNVGECLTESVNAISSQQMMSELTTLYQNFRMKKINAASWRRESSKIIDRMIQMNENDASARLFQAQLLISEERYNEAEWILEHANSLLSRFYYDNEELNAYYLYLTSLIHRDERYVNDIYDEVMKIYKRNPSNWRVAWMVLNLSDEYNRSASGRWVFLEKQFNYGCTSPVMYTEALTLLNMNPTLLHKLDNFELQILNYGSKQQYLNSELKEQLLYLADRKKEFSLLLLDILYHLYEKKPDNSLLTQICTLLIKGNKSGERYFDWYEKAVNEQLRITNLFEYYMLSIPMENSVEIPKMVLMYFSYQNELDYRHSAYLYSYIVKNKEVYPDIYAAYESKINQFVTDQIEKMHVNSALANLYQRVLTPEMIDEHNCEMLSRVLFASRIRVTDDRIVKVYVYQPGNLTPASYLFKDLSTWVSIYGNDNTLVFEDAFGNLFTKSVEYTIEKLMIPGRFLRTLAKYDCKCADFDLFLVTNEQNMNEDADITRMLRVVASDNIEKHTKRDLCILIMQTLYDNDEMKRLDEFLDIVSTDELGTQERSQVIRYMVLRGKYDVAYECVRKYGPYFVDPKVIVRLVGEMIQNNSLQESPDLTASALYAFQKNKYNSTVLQYLCLYFEGSTKEMRDVYKAAVSFGVDAFRIAERIIAQMISTGAFIGDKMEIFKYYVSQGGRQEIVNAFLIQCSYDYFVKDKLVEEYVFHEILLAYLRSEEVDRVCKLAYLKYMAECPEDIREEDVPVIREFLQEMMRANIHFSFYEELESCRDITESINDKTIIEYRAKGGKRARIHYIVTDENGEADEYLTEYMTEVVDGVFFIEFILFFGETIQYYITEESDNSEELTQSGSLQKNEIASRSENSMYDMINDIVISKNLQDYETCEDLLDDFYYRQFRNRKLFTIV